MALVHHLNAGAPTSKGARHGEPRQAGTWGVMRAVEPMAMAMNVGLEAAAIYTYTN